MMRSTLRNEEMDHQKDHVMEDHPSSQLKKVLGFYKNSRQLSNQENLFPPTEILFSPAINGFLVNLVQICWNVTQKECFQLHGHPVDTTGVKGVAFYVCIVFKDYHTSETHSETLQPFLFCKAEG